MHTAQISKSSVAEQLANLLLGLCALMVRDSAQMICARGCLLDIARVDESECDKSRKAKGGGQKKDRAW